MRRRASPLRLLLSLSPALQLQKDCAAPALWGYPSLGLFCTRRSLEALLYSPNSARVVYSLERLVLPLVCCFPHHGAAPACRCAAPGLAPLPLQGKAEMCIGEGWE